MNAVPINFIDAAERYIDGLSYGSHRTFYIATVKVGDKIHYCCTAAGFVRWSENLGYAIAGMGLSIGKKEVKERAADLCRFYKDQRPDQIKIVPLTTIQALDALSDLRQ